MTLPIRAPAERETRRVCITPCVSRSDVPVSDDHKVASCPVPPLDPMAVNIAKPICEPSIVTLAEPVVAEFDPNATLSAATPAEMASEAVPTKLPTDAITRNDECNTWLVLQTSDVSPRHSVDSQPVQPCLTPSLISRSPSPEPCTVSLSDPVPTTFDRLTTLRVSDDVDIASVDVPTMLPTVTNIRPLPCPAWALLHSTDVADSQEVRSQPDSPIRVLTQD